MHIPAHEPIMPAETGARQSTSHAQHQHLMPLRCHTECEREWTEWRIGGHTGVHPVTQPPVIPPRIESMEPSRRQEAASRSYLNFRHISLRTCSVLPGVDNLA